MTDTRLRNFLFGTVLAGGLATGAASCNHKDVKEPEPEEPKTEIRKDTVQAQDTVRVQIMPEINSDDPYGNIALFKATYSKIKFALALVENYYPYTYNDNKGKGTWTTGEGLTHLRDANGKVTKVTENTPAVTAIESDVYKGRFLTSGILPVIKKVKKPMDENTLIAACVLGYCVGPSKLASSSFLKQVNVGANGAELTKYLTLYHKQGGVPKRLYFFAALIENQIQWADLLNLRAEGCYNLGWKDIFVYDTNNVIKTLPGKLYEWDYTNIKANLEKAKKKRSSTLYIKGGQKVTIECQLAREFVPDYVWFEVSSDVKETDADKTEKIIDFTFARTSFWYAEQNNIKQKYQTQKKYGIVQNIASNTVDLDMSKFGVGRHYISNQKRR